MDTQAMVRRVRDGMLGFIGSPPDVWNRSAWDDAAHAEFLADLDYCLDVDRFDFAMVVRRREGLLLMEPAS